MCLSNTYKTFFVQSGNVVLVLSGTAIRFLRFLSCLGPQEAWSAARRAADALGRNPRKKRASER